MQCACGSLQTLPDGTANDYYLGFSKMKQYCDEDYDLVFTTTFGHMSQTIDVSSGYGPCTVAADGGAARPQRVRKGMQGAICWLCGEGARCNIVVSVAVL